ncbi:hypothetical protein DFH08DRAFT_789564 [Mycena albidolilacea]|uniref:Indoleamine 2,3-dioxygenase n=1 Tax=Mycena albidolilacea TaxID=1033008 RepID=A0AAD7EGL9_9AGAR|nr:hypothetical protein DFH08DRAFT_789564 [Mycena albidolilacea]
MFSWIFSTYSSPSPAVVVSPGPSTKILQDPLNHRAIECLRDLVQLGGGGTWPPTATYDDSWPLPLRAYHSVFRAMETSLPVEEPSLIHARNREIIDSFRARMRSELERRIKIPEVERTLEEWESQSGVQSAWLGFFTCISFLRHAYRWGVTPIVSEAQSEASVEFPQELDLPWSALQRHFGISSPSGCMTSICYSNMASDEILQYSVTAGMGEVHNSTEFWNTKLVVDMETKLLPAYHLFAQAISFMDFRDPDAAQDALKSANDILRAALKYFFNTMVDSKISHTVWMAYVQGFQGWALEGIDGISGGQSLLFRTMDSFLGIRPWPTPEKERLHIPEAQRNWLNCLRDYDIRAVAKEREYIKVTNELDSLVKQLRVWRMGHMRRMQPYESQNRPERKTMTAGISVVDAPDGEQMILHLKKELGRRLAQTV